MLNANHSTGLDKAVLKICNSNPRNLRTRRRS